MHRVPHVLLALTCAVTLVACGDGIDPEAAEGTSDAAARLEVAGTDQLLWRPPELTAGAGPVDFRVECGLNTGHELAIEGVRGGEPIASCDAAGTGAGSVELEAGTYTFFCAVPGHREEGMEGELIIE